jgi:hypothetical protein
VLLERQLTDAEILLVAMVITDAEPPILPPTHRRHVMERWGHLLAARGHGEYQNGMGVIPDSVRIQYGPHNQSTIY